MRVVPIAVIIIVNGHQFIRVVKIRSSPIKLIVGGRAIFVRLAMIHHEVISGKIIWAPCSSRSARLCVRS